MTLEELSASMPEKLRPWVSTYGPAFLEMTGQEIMAWLQMVIRGDVIPAYAAVLAKLPSGDLLAEWESVNANWASANADNADRIAAQKAAAIALVKILLAIAFAVIGL